MLCRVVWLGHALIRQVRSPNIYILGHQKNELKSRKLSDLNQNSDELLCNVLPAETAADVSPHLSTLPCLLSTIL